MSNTKELFSLPCMLSCCCCLIWLSSNVAAMSNFGIIDFLKDVQSQHGFENVLIMQNQNATMAQQFVWENIDENAVENPFAQLDSSSEFVKRIMTELHVSVLRMNELTTIYIKRHFSAQMMSIVVIDGTFIEHMGLLKNLVLNLRHMTITKVLFLLNSRAEEKSTILMSLFRDCWSNKIINVAAIFTDFQVNNVYYSYTNFPEFTLEMKQLPSSKAQLQEIYAYRLGDLKGYKLPYILGGTSPRIIAYLDKHGKRVIAGFAGHFLKAFSKKFNSVLYEPLPAKLNAHAPSRELIAAVRNGTVEISAALTFPTIPMSGYTYPYEQINWCVTTPVESDIPGYEFYVRVFELTAFLLTLAAITLISMVLSVALYHHGFRVDLLDMFVHRDCLRGVLGQTFSEVVKPPNIVRFIYLQICFLGIILTTYYNAYFATYITKAPKEAALQNFDDILNSNIQIYAYTPEFNELIWRLADYKRYIPKFHLEHDYQKYLKMRDSFNTQFAYMMATTKWKIINEQQKVFTTPILKRNEKLCIINNIPMCFPVHENSIFQETLYQLMLETAQSGLTDHWQKSAFREMIAAGKLSFKDLSGNRSFKAMKVDDLFYVWFGFTFMVGLDLLVFIAELCVFKRKKWLRSFKRIFYRGHSV